HFEAARTSEAFIERDVVQQGSDGDDLGIVLCILKLSDSCRKEPRADNMVEQVGFTFLPGIFDRPANERRIGNSNSREHPTSDLGHVHSLLFSFKRRVRGRRCAFHRTSTMLLATPTKF